MQRRNRQPNPARRRQIESRGTRQFDPAGVSSLRREFQDPVVPVVGIPRQGESCCSSGKRAKNPRNTGRDERRQIRNHYRNAPCSCSYPPRSSTPWQCPCGALPEQSVIAERTLSQASGTSLNSALTEMITVPGAKEKPLQASRHRGSRVRAQETQDSPRAVPGAAGANDFRKSGRRRGLRAINLSRPLRVTGRLTFWRACCACTACSCSTA